MVYEEALDCARIEYDQYIDIAMNLKLRKGATYDLRVSARLPEGCEIGVGVCGTEHPLEENKALSGADGKMEGVQLLTRYRYTDAVTGKNLRYLLFLCSFIFLTIALGLPKDQKFRRAVKVILLAACPPVLGIRLEMLTLQRQFLLPHALYYNMAILYLLEILVLLCTGSLRFTIVFSSFAFTALYSVNGFMYDYRGVPLRLNDLTAIRTAMGVAGRYDFSPGPEMAKAWGVAVLFIVLALAAGRQRREGSRGRKAILGLVCRIGARVALAAGLAWGAGYLLLYTDYLLERGFVNFHGIDQFMTYHFDGYLVASCMDIQNSRIPKPEGYSAEAAAEILGAFGGKGDPVEPEELPHVILIMNESFADLRVLGNLELNEDNLAFTNSLKENTVRGYVNASSLGGGTSNSEFEVLTGCSMGLLPGSYYAYQQCILKPMDSLVSSMERAGYTSYSMHPAPAYNYNRGMVYQYLGFDSSQWAESFADAEKIHAGASDRATYERIRSLFEERDPGEKMFIFDVTIQNHGDYGGDGQTVKALNVRYDEVDCYLSLMKTSDEAFEELVRYFAGEEEKVIICMFGDHQPKFNDGQFYTDVSSGTEGLTENDKILNQYKTPFVIWANYDLEEAEGLDISMNYLGVLLQQKAGIPMTPYFAFLAEQMKEYPIITVNGYVDREGNYSNWSGEGNEFPEYRILQYNYLFDGDVVPWGY